MTTVSDASLSAGPEPAKGRAAGLPDAAAPGSSSRLRPLDYVTYGVGMAGNQILGSVPTMLLLFFMTNTLFIPAALAGIAILAPKLWVIVADPLVGSFSDRTRTRWGPRKPFMFFGSIASTLAFVLLFTCPVPAAPVAATLVVGGLYLILSTAYSVYSVPYLTLAAEIGSEAKQRVLALSARQVFGLIGVLAGMALAPWMIEKFGNGRPAYAIMAMTLGVIVFASTMLTAIFCPVGRGTQSAAPVTGNLLRQMLRTFDHKPFRVVFAAATVSFLGVGMFQAGFIYFQIYVLKLPLSSLSLSIILGTIGALATQPLWIKLAARLGVVRGFQVANLIFMVAGLVYLVIPIQNEPAYWAASFFSGACSCGASLMAFSALVEAIGMDGEDSNRRALFTAAFTASEKAMLALGSFAMACALAAAHFIQGAPFEQQPASVGPGLIVAFALIPTALRLISIVLIGRFPKDEAQAA